VTESETPTNETTSTPETPGPEAAAVEAAPAVEPPAEMESEEIREMPTPPSSGVYWGTGRRKSAVARVRLIPGEGKILINKREVDQYFSEPQEQLAVRESLLATKTEKSFDVFVNVGGGGHAGQAGAIRLGVARALVKANAGYEAALREKNYLTRDARVVERKKYGQRKARRRFQFSKR
jgi:small subunit ribosomal protein S9